MKKTGRKKIGLLGGTFNPVHLGHLRASVEVIEMLDLDKIYFIPAYLPPHKTNEGIASPTDRLRMLKLAINGNSLFEISDIELNRGGNSYTVDTLRYFTNAFPEFDSYFILGSELLSEIESWKDYKDLFRLSNIAVLKRPGYSHDILSLLPLELRDDFRYYKEYQNVALYRNKSSKILTLLKIDGLEISSTRIRDLVSENKSISYLVPSKVESYIRSRKVYKKEAFK